MWTRQTIAFPGGTAVAAVHTAGAGEAIRLELRAGIVAVEQGDRFRTDQGSFVVTRIRDIGDRGEDLEIEAAPDPETAKPQAKKKGGRRNG